MLSTAAAAPPEVPPPPPPPASPANNCELLLWLPLPTIDFKPTAVITVATQSSCEHRLPKVGFSLAYGAEGTGRRGGV